MSYRILLVDDEKDILEFVGYNLQREGYEVFTATNGEEGLRMALEYRPHLILLDMMMPVMDGEQTCRAIRSHPEIEHTLVVFLTALGGDDQQVAGFNMGADDYITKPIKLKILISRIQAILKRVPTDNVRGQQAGIAIDKSRYVVKINGEELSLPRKEFALLELLCSAPEQLFTREEIYREVWGSEVVVGDRTIDVHIRKLRQKIGEQHIITIKGVGYKYIP